MIYCGRTNQSLYFHRRSVLYGLCIFCLFFGGRFCCFVNACALEETAVTEVQGISDLKRDFLKGISKHEHRFVYSYPGIEEEFNRRYFSHGSYQCFFDELSIRDSYHVGILSGTCIYFSGDSQRYMVIQVEYLTTKRQEKVITRKVKKIATHMNQGTKLERVRKAYDYVINHMQYDTKYYNPYYAFTKHRGMCMSYALVYQRLMQELRIPCLYIKGRNHAWNMVCLNHEWYNVDATWDDARKTYCYFLKCDREFPNHNRPKNRIYKSLKLAKQSYYY